ncbi:unnamed protein product [Albugo candida]|uniref:Uncharacterized protein n=1 Tax=Albugo candida TaxID=65357 RepID=A0A024G4H0_9STRA|nr:unnamed protein product [Albugo candida]|eukprot:CCI41417.1 unnamed protein product [Albugo candida]
MGSVPFGGVFETLQQIGWLWWKLLTQMVTTIQWCFGSPNAPLPNSFIEAAATPNVSVPPNSVLPRIQTCLLCFQIRPNSIQTRLLCTVLLNVLKAEDRGSLAAFEKAEIQFEFVVSFELKFTFATVNRTKHLSIHLVE